MIRLTCANCRNTLEVDDAFAGGVCRCQHCGTIQTVPKSASGNRPRSPRTGASLQPSDHAADEPKALYQVKSRAGISSHPSGLEELAEVVHSSGLSGSGMLNRTAAPLPYATPSQQKKSRAGLILGVTGGVVLLSIVLIVSIRFLGARTTTTAAATNAQAAAVTTTPAFGTIALSGDKVIYVIDRGDATAAFFPAIKTLTTRSVRSLGPERRFAVMLWHNGSDDSFPHSGTVYATAEEVGKLGNWLDNISTGRATSVNSAIANALAQSPKEIILLTAKSDQLDPEEFAATISKIRSGKQVRIHTISLGNSSDDDPLKKVAAETGGKYLRMTAGELNNLSD